MYREERIELARKSLKGLSIGDAFGESFFGEREMILQCIEDRIIPETSWDFTDDTIMSIAVYEQLEKYGEIHQTELAELFSENHKKDLNRGYGSTARMILRGISEGKAWDLLSQGVFDGMGSMGNGASMRVSSIGAYHYDDYEKVKELCVKSAEITHSNIEGITGAIAVGISTALATRLKIKGLEISPKDFVSEILEELPESDTKSKIRKSQSVPYTYNIETVRTILGDGSKIISQDTVPFCIWCASNNLKSYENALWKGVSILGDRDTICAIIGGITIMSSEENNRA